MSEDASTGNPIKGKLFEVEKRAGRILAIDLSLAAALLLLVCLCACSLNDSSDDPFSQGGVAWPRGGLLNMLPVVRVVVPLRLKTKILLMLDSWQTEASSTQSGYRLFASYKGYQTMLIEVTVEKQ